MTRDVAPGRILALGVVAVLVALAGGAHVGAAAGGTTVSIAPSDDSVDVGGTTTFQVVVDDAQGGVGAAEIRVAVDDASVAEVVDVTVFGSGATSTTIADDGSYADVEYAFRNTEDSGSVAVAEVTVEGVAAGQTGLSLQAAEGNADVLVFDEGGIGYDVTGTSGASVTVEGAQQSTPTPEPATPTPEPATPTPEPATPTPEPATPTPEPATPTPTDEEPAIPPVDDFANSPTDPDGDGEYEDVNGDGTFDIVDVQALFANQNGDTVQNNVAAFDFNDDGVVDVVDVQALYAELNLPT